jgi:hypothetical protein
MRYLLIIRSDLTSDTFLVSFENNLNVWRICRHVTDGHRTVRWGAAETRTVIVSKL